MDSVSNNSDSEEESLVSIECLVKDCQQIFTKCHCELDPETHNLHDFELPKTSYTTKNQLGLFFPDSILLPAPPAIDFNRKYDLFVSSNLFLLPSESVIIFLYNELFAWAEQMISRNERYFAFTNKSSFELNNKGTLEFRSPYVTLVQILKTNCKEGNQFFNFYIQAFSRLRVPCTNEFEFVYKEDLHMVFTNIDMIYDPVITNNTLLEDQILSLYKIISLPHFSVKPNFDTLRRQILSFYRNYPMKHCQHMNPERMALFIIRNYKFTTYDKIEAFKYDYWPHILTCLWKKMKRSDIVCVRCRYKLAHTDNIMCFEKECCPTSLLNCYGYYSNPSLTTMELLILDQLETYRRESNTYSVECSWFDSYLWSAVLCRGCTTFIGFQFMICLKSNTLPESFVGLRKAAIELL